MAKGTITIDLADESVTFNKEEVTIVEREQGIAIMAKSGAGDGLGFLRQFFPWNEVRRVTENAA